MSLQTSASEPIRPFTIAIGRHAVAVSLEARLVTAQPRLRHIVRFAGIPAAAQDDVVQETLLAAWRYHAQLKEPERFDAWLDAICRNQCRLFWRTNATRDDEQDRFLDGLALNQGAADDIVDLQSPDPLDDLDQRETIDLIARALAYLTPPARQLLTLRYLADLPEREVAEVLHISIPTLEARLHRARRQLRAIMEGPLRAEVAEAGLLPVTEDDAGWRPTPLWCNACGKQRLVGRFETHVHGGRELRLRCPVCSPRYDEDVYRTLDMPEMVGMTSMRAALNRSMRVLAQHTHTRIATGLARCGRCGTRVQTRIASARDIPISQTMPVHHYWSFAECFCPVCGYIESAGLGAWMLVEPVLWFQPAAHAFMRAHPRWISLPETIVEWQGRAAMRFLLADVAGPARFTAFVDATTLAILDTFTE
jgi:RNA polymerase sigma factor (sigma-70 family)